MNDTLTVTPVVLHHGHGAPLVATTVTGYEAFKDGGSIIDASISLSDGASAFRIDFGAVGDDTAETLSEIVEKRLAIHKLIQRLQEMDAFLLDMLSEA